MSDIVKRVEQPKKVDWPPFLDKVQFDFSSATKYLRMGLPEGYRAMVNIDECFIVSVPRSITPNSDVDVTVGCYEEIGRNKTLTLNTMVKGIWYPLKNTIVFNMDHRRYLLKYRQYLEDYKKYKDWFDKLGTEKR